MPLKGQIALRSPRKSSRIAQIALTKTDPKPTPHPRRRTSSVSKVSTSVTTRKKLRSSLSQSCSDEIEKQETPKTRKNSISTENSTFDAVMEVSFSASPSKNKVEVQKGEEQSLRNTSEKSSVNAIAGTTTPDIVVDCCDDENQNSTVSLAILSPNIKISHKLARKSPKQPYLTPHKLTFNTPPETGRILKKTEDEVIEISDEYQTPDFSDNKIFKFPRSSSVIFVKPHGSDDNAKEDKRNFSRNSSINFLDFVPKYQMRTNRNSEYVKESAEMNDTVILVSKSKVSPDHDFGRLADSDEDDEDETRTQVKQNLFQVEKEQPAEEKEERDTFLAVATEEPFEGSSSQTKTEEQGDMSEEVLTIINKKIGKRTKPEEPETSRIDETDLDMKSSNGNENIEKFTIGNGINKLNDTASMDIVEHQEILEEILNPLSKTQMSSFQNETLDKDKMIEEIELIEIEKEHGSAEDLSNIITPALEEDVDDNSISTETEKAEEDVSQIEETVKVMIKKNGTKRRLEDDFEEVPNSKKICEVLISVSDYINNNNLIPNEFKRIRPTTIIRDSVGSAWYVDFDPDIKPSITN